MAKSAFNNFCAWAKARNAEKNCDIPTSVEALKNTDIDKLSNWLEYFVMETRDQHGEFCKPETLYRIVCNFQLFFAK